jgi:uncharacterized protein (DUF924 family)
MTDQSLPAPADILSYWFSPDVREKWFKPDAAFDAELKRRFGSVLELARFGALESWAETPNGALALVVLLDQGMRNIHRDTPEAFAGDPVALTLAKHAIARGFDAGFDTDRRYALYLPFMHSEVLADQDRGVALFTALGHEEGLRYMRLHRDIIARFGRFPHRNAILGRPSTPEELAFLEQPGSSF